MDDFSVCAVTLTALLMAIGWLLSSRVAFVAARASKEPQLQQQQSKNQRALLQDSAAEPNPLRNLPNPNNVLAEILPEIDPALDPEQRAGQCTEPEE